MDYHRDEVQDLLSELKKIKEKNISLSVAYKKEVKRRKRAEENQKKSELLYNALVEQVSDTFFVHDIKGKIIEENQQSCDSHSYLKEEYLSMTGTNIEQGIDLKAVQNEWVKKTPEIHSTLYEQQIRKDDLTSAVEVRLECLNKIENKNFLGLVRNITEHCKIQKDLKTGEERFRRTLDTMMEGCQIIGFDWRYKYVNDAVVAQAHKTKNELLGRTIMEVYPGVEDTEMFGLLRRCMHIRTSHHMENEFSFSDGTTGWFELSIQPSPEGIFVLSMDLNKRKRAEEALKRSETKFRKIVEGAPDPIFIQTENKFAYLNPSACQLFRLQSADELIGKLVFESIHPLYHEKVKKRIHRLNIERESVSDILEQKFLRNDGSEVWVETKAEPIIYNQKKGALVFVRDITERKQAEEIVQKSRAKLDAALASMNDAVFISDINGKFIDFNDAFATFHKFKNKNECLKTFAEYPDILDVFMSDGTLAPLEKWAVPRALRGESVTNAEYILQRKDTGETWVGSYSFGPIRDKNGAIIGSVVVGRDITEHKQADEELQKLKERLEETVAERTEQLIAANKELESFSYSVSHDLRAPLRAINGYSKFLIEDYSDKLDDEGKRFVHTIRQNTEKMDQLISDLLNFSQISNSEMNIVKANMCDIALSIYHEIATDEEKKAFEIKCNNMPMAYCDVTLIKLVWQNLLANAIKYSSKSNIKKIEISAYKDEKEIIFCIKDHGAGFNEKYKDKLFGVFKRLHGIEEFEGTGIGLAIVQRIIHRHGGRVWGEGAVNVGASFYFTIPAHMHDELTQF